MTQRERFLETCRFARGVVPPWWDCFGFWDQTISRWHGEGLPHGVPPEKHFGMDMRPCIPTVSHWHIAMDPPFLRETLAEDDATITYRNEFGVIAREYRKNNESSMPQFLEFPVKSRRDFEGLASRLDPHTTGRYPDWTAASRELAASGEEVGLMITGCFGFLRDLVGYEGLAFLLYDDPGLVHDICAQWAALEMGISEEAASRIQIDYVYVWEDMACKNGPLLSPRMFETFILPCYRQVMGHLKQLGIRCILVDSDGNNDLLVPLFLQGGVTGLLPLEAAAGTDPIALRKLYGERLLLCGGIDKRVLAKGKREIEREIMAKVPPLLEGGGYIPAVDHSVPPDVSFENYSFYVELIRTVCARGSGRR